jgi:hypothetical protein
VARGWNGGRAHVGVGVQHRQRGGVLPMEMVTGPMAGLTVLGRCWTSIQVSTHGQLKNEKRLFIFQIFSKFQTNLNSNQIYNFDDFHSHNKT